MTIVLLVFASAPTAYILIAIQLEQQDLLHFHGDSYRKYRKPVPMLVRFVKRGSRQCLDHVTDSAG